MIERWVSPDIFVNVGLLASVPGLEQNAEKIYSLHPTATDLLSKDRMMTDDGRIWWLVIALSRAIDTRSS